MLQNGVSVSINSDDPTVFKTSVTEEMEIVYEKVGIDVGRIEGIMREALEKSFASEKEKEHLVKLIK